MIEHRRLWKYQLMRLGDYCKELTAVARADVAYERWIHG